MSVILGNYTIFFFHWFLSLTLSFSPSVSFFLFFSSILFLLQNLLHIRSHLFSLCMLVSLSLSHTLPYCICYNSFLVKWNDFVKKQKKKLKLFNGLNVFFIDWRSILERWIFVSLWLSLLEHEHFSYTLITMMMMMLIAATAATGYALIYNTYTYMYNNLFVSTVMYGMQAGMYVLNEFLEMRIHFIGHLWMIIIKAHVWLIVIIWTIHNWIMFG